MRRGVSDRRFLIGDVETRVHAGAGDTGGGYALIEQQHPPGRGAPLHYHLHESEGFYVLEGEYLFVIGDERRQVGKGEFVFAAKGTPHAFVNRGPDLARMLILLTPAGGERYFELMSELPKDGPERSREQAALDDRFGMVMVKPSNE